MIIPDLFGFRGPWRYPAVLDAFTATLDRLGLDQVTLIGHSFGGGIELGFASRFPGRVVELVFSDTLAVSREWGLADEALRHPAGVAGSGHAAGRCRVRAHSWLTHPRQLVDAGWWGFTSDRDG